MSNVISTKAMQKNIRTTPVQYIALCYSQQACLCTVISDLTFGRVIQPDVKKNKSLSSGDIAIAETIFNHVGKDLGDDGGHQAFGMVFEVGHRLLRPRHTGPVDDLFQLQRGTIGVQDAAEVGE
ncbi:MAG: hypothetical protein L6R36_008768, partial [Xanthoria steineri]